LVGTINPQLTGYLRDPSGGRRFWPLEVAVTHDIHVEALEKDIDQLWAEAVVRYRAGEKWWPTDPTIKRLLEAAQAERYQADPWTATVVETALDLWGRVKAAGKLPGVALEAITREAFPKLKDAEHLVDEKIQQRIGGILLNEGWVRSRPRHNKTRSRLYRPGPKRRRRRGPG
jgi:predicted P-loop ATPase